MKNDSLFSVVHRSTKSPGTRISFRHVIGLLALTLSTAAFAGCAVSAESEEVNGDDVMGEAASALTCCQQGTVLCPNNVNIDVDYGCGGTTRQVAITNCNKLCTVACRDSGWHTYCY